MDMVTLGKLRKFKYFFILVPDLRKQFLIGGGGGALNSNVSFVFISFKYVEYIVGIEYKMKSKTPVLTSININVALF